MNIRGLLCLFLGGLCSACANMRHFEVETFNPADVTYPKNVQKVLMVNNAVPQPANTGYSYSLYGKMQDTCRAVADSALIDFCRSLGTSIVETPYFQDVLLYDHAFRTDDAYLKEGRLTQEDVRRLCEENNADAIISLDRALFVMNKDVQAFPQMGMEYGTIKVKFSGILRTYIPEKEKALATVLVADSVQWEEAAGNLTYLNEVLPSPEKALRFTAAYIGSQASKHFVPHWSEASRWYYQNIGARWKEASAFAAAGKWELAEKCWLMIKRQTRNKQSLAEVSANLALACEMQNKFSEAFEQAKKSYELFVAIEGEDGENTQLLKAYSLVLYERISADKKLNRQISE